MYFYRFAANKFAQISLYSSVFSQSAAQKIKHKTASDKNTL